MKNSCRNLFTFFLIVACLAGFATGGNLGAERQTEQEAERQIHTDQGAGQEIFTIKVDVNLVTTDVTVIGAASDLTAEDFVIFDNNVSQQVSHFSKDQHPLAVALLVDGSLSIKPYLPMLQIAAASALRRLKQEDQVMLYSFNANTLRLSDLTENRHLVADRIGELKVALGTNIFGTIFEAADYLSKKAPRRRRAIILVSDNCHAMGTYSVQSSRVALLETATTLYNIRTPGDNLGAYASGCFQSDTEIRQLAADTGGEVLDVQKPLSLQAALEKAISRLRMQYTLGFSPSDQGKKGSFHKLTVRLASKEHCRDCRVLARSGYYAGIAPALPPHEEVPVAPQLSPQKIDQLLIRRSIMTAGTIDLELAGIPFTVKTAEQRRSGAQPQLKVNLQIGPAGIAFGSVEGRRTCRLQVAIFYANSKREILGSEWKSIEGKLSDEAYSRIQHAGIPFSTLVPLKAEKQMLKIVVYDEGSDNVGSKLVRVR